MPQYIYTRNSIYDNIEEIVKGEEYSEIINKYVYCIDKIDNLKYDRCSFYNDKAKYLVYFDTITTQNFEETKKYPNFLKAFCRLEKCEDNFDLIKSNFDKLSFKNVEFSIFTLLKENLLYSETTINLTKEIENIIKSRLDNFKEIKQIAKATFLMYYKNKKIEDASNEVGLSSEKPLLLIIKYKIFAQFLTAFNYVNIVKSALNNRLTENDKNALNQLYDDDITRFIVEYFKNNNYENNVIEFEKRNYKKLDFSGKATLTYIIGKMVKEESRILKILDSEMDILKKAYNDKLKQPSSFKGRLLYEYYVAKRSIEIGKTRNDKNYNKNNIYILQLLSDKNERRINRDFYLEFYGDRSKRELFLGNEVILKGHDFYNTYHTLASRIEKWLKYGRRNCCW